MCVASSIPGTPATKGSLHHQGTWKNNIPTLRSHDVITFTGQTLNLGEAAQLGQCFAGQGPDSWVTGLARQARSVLARRTEASLAEA